MRQARLIARGDVVHNHDGMQPTAVYASYGQFLETDKQPYVRYLDVGEDWQAVGLGWLDDASAVCIQNLEGDFAVNPTREERAAVGSRVLEVAFGEGAAVLEVRPKNTQTLFPVAGAAAGVRIRSRVGNARVKVTVMPK